MVLLVLAAAAVGLGLGAALAGVVRRFVAADEPDGGSGRDDGGGRPGLVVSTAVWTAAVYALLAARFGPRAELPAFLYLGAIGVTLAGIDLRTRRLPDALTLPSYPLGIGLLALGLLDGGSGATLLRALGGMAALFALYLLLALLAPGGLGFGDVKLAGLLGLYLAWLSWGTWAVGAVGGFALGGATALVLVLAGRAGRHTALPFGPFMLLGALLAVLAGDALAAGYLDLALGLALNLAANTAIR